MPIPGFSSVFVQGWDLNSGPLATVSEAGCHVLGAAQPLSMTVLNVP